MSHSLSGLVCFSQTDTWKDVSGCVHLHKEIEECVFKLMIQVVSSLPNSAKFVITVFGSYAPVSYVWVFI